MAKVVFFFEGFNIDIPCNLDDKIEKIFIAFSSKLNLNRNNLIFLYGGALVNDEDYTFEDIANNEDLKNKTMNILVYKLEMYKTTQSFRDNLFIEDLKPKILDILKKYLDDREYLEDKVDRWRDAILNECKSILSSFKKFKTFINVMIKNEKKQQKDFLRSRYSDYKYYLQVKFQTKSIFGLIIIIFLDKDKKRIDLNISDSFDLIKNEFLNLAEGRSYKIFKEKYFQMLRQKIREVRSGYGTDLFIFYELSNKNIMATRGFDILNKGKDDKFLNEVIKAEDYSFYLLLAKLCNN